LFTRICLLLIILWAGLLANNVSGQEKSISILTEDNWSDYGGSHAAERARSVLEVLGYEVTVVFVPWARALKMTEEGMFEVLAGVYFSEERNKKLAFSEPITTTDILFYKLKSSDISYDGNLNSLKELRIGVVRNYIYSNEFDEANYLEKMIALNPKNNIELLLAERVDLIVGSRKAIDFLLASKFSGSSGQLESLPIPLESKSVHVAFSREHAGYKLLLEDFNRTFARLKKEGSFE